MTKKKLLLLGAGPTSSLIAYNIKTSPRLQDAFDIRIWEKSTRVGGRFSTSRIRTNPNCYADLGAQYLTYSGNAVSRPYFNSLIDSKLIKEFDTKNIPGFRSDPTKVNYVCSFGTESVVKHFFEKAGESNITLSFNKLANKIKPNTENGTIEVSANQNEWEAFDIVVITIPVPQVLQLENIEAFLLGDLKLKSELEKVSYTTRFALGLFYDKKEGPFSNFSSVSKLNFTEDPIIKYWSVENKKRNNPESEEACSIVVHTSVAFGAENSEKTKDSMKEFLMEKVKGVIKDVEQNDPAFVKCHKWKYSQVDKSFPGEPGQIQLGENVILAGDGFTRSGFEGCIESSLKTIKVLEMLV